MQGRRKVRHSLNAYDVLLRVSVIPRRQSKQHGHQNKKAYRVKFTNSQYVKFLVSTLLNTHLKTYLDTYYYVDIADGGGNDSYAIVSSKYRVKAVADLSEMFTILQIVYIWCVYEMNLRNIYVYIYLRCLE